MSVWTITQIMNTFQINDLLYFEVNEICMYNGNTAFL